MIPPPLPVPVSALAPFSDRLNPMLVKELRQGLRHKVFIGAFVIIQAAMLLFVGLQLLSDVNENIAETLDTVLWAGMGFVLMVMMPMRALTAINEEKKGNTLELVQVTRLDSFRIVFGKWVSCVALTLLLVVSVLPYAVLRYFFGGVDVVENLASLGMMMLGSFTMTAGALWLSTMGPAGRSLGIIGAIMMAESSMMAFSFMSRGPMSVVFGPMMGTSSLDLGSVGMAAFLNTIFLLALAASRIAAASENHAAILRSIAICSGVVGIALSRFAGSLCFGLVAPLMLWSIYEALTERTSEFPALYRPWALRGWWGRMAGRVLNPGWATGLIFSALILSLLFVGSTVVAQDWGRSDCSLRALACVLLFLAAIMPLPVLLLLPRVKQRGGLYFVVLLFGLAVFVAARFVEDAVGKEAAALLDAITPVSAFAAALMHSSSEASPQWPLFIAITLPMGGVILLILLFKSFTEFRLMREMERRAIQPHDEP